MIQIDDFYTNTAVVDGLRHLFEITDTDVCIFVLLGQSNMQAMQEIVDKRATDFPLSAIGIHGWNHIAEPQYGYWQMRHLLEVARSWKCFDKMMTLPWNRMPTRGALRAIKEKGYTLCTPYKAQRVFATILGCNSIDLGAEMLLHPPDLLDKDRLEKIVEKIDGKDTD